MASGLILSRPSARRFRLRCCSIPSNRLARAYGATVTPHMYIIKPDGVLAYAGGIDDKSTTRPADIKDAKNFVDEALAELKAGKPVSNPATRAYGCTVKYSS
jgi:hypothetical protein